MNSDLKTLELAIRYVRDNEARYDSLVRSGNKFEANAFRQETNQVMKDVIALSLAYIRT